MNNRVYRTVAYNIKEIAETVAKKTRASFDGEFYRGARRVAESAAHKATEAAAIAKARLENVYRGQRSEQNQDK